MLLFELFDAKKQRGRVKNRRIQLVEALIAGVDAIVCFSPLDGLRLPLEKLADLQCLIRIQPPVSEVLIS